MDYYNMPVNNEYTKTSKRKPVLIICTIIELILLFGILFFCFFKTQRWKTVTYELGTATENNIRYYMKGSSFALRKGTVDTSGVDVMTAGSYTAFVVFKKNIYPFSIIIEDTTPPDIVLADYSNINIGMDYDTNILYKEITDLSGEVDVKITVDNVSCDTLHFNTISDYKIGILAEDINGNLSKEEFVIRTVDTIAPEITGLSEYAYYGVGDSYYLNDFVSDITDNSGNYETSILVNGAEQSDNVSFSDAGEYAVEVVAKDSEGNCNKFNVVVNADYRPVLYGTSSKVIKLNTEYNLLEGVFAWDNEEGFITDRISVEGTVNLNEAGDYLTKYSITDRNGLLTEASVVYSVEAKNYNSKTEYPDELIDKMFEADAFQYELLTEADSEAAANLMYPCQVAFRVVDVFQASGFIYKIDRDYIYIGTMGHCIDAKMKREGINIWFYNPTYDSEMSHKSTKRCLEAVPVEEYTRVYSGSDDRAMFKIKLEYIPNDVLIYLKEVNKTNENNISLTNGIYTDTIYVAKDMYTGRFKKSFNVYNRTGEEYDHLYNYFSQYQNKSKWLLTNEGGVSGQSGSLLYDGYGNPVASLSGRLFYKSAVIGRHVLFNHYAELYDKLK